MKIISLEAENIKRIQAVQIKPNGELVVIGGDNAQGKSSVLDSIVMALAGGKSIPEMPIRKGQQQAEIRIDLGEFIVMRRFSAKTGPSLKVIQNDGTAVTSPQKLLDGLTAKLGFDPLQFSRMGAVEQRETLRKLLGLDFTKLDEDRFKLYNERTVKNREVDGQTHRIRGMARFPNAPKEAPDVSALTAELKRAEEANNKKADADRRVVQLQAVVGNVARDLALARDAFEQAKNRLVKTESEHKQAASDLDAAVEAAKKLEPVSTDPILEKLNAASEISEQHTANTRYTEEAERLKVLNKEAETMTKQIEKIDQTKADMIGKAQFPIAGLGFSDTGVTLNELPFDQASDAERLKVSVAIGLAMNPKLKVLIIRDGSLLDTNNLKLVAEMAAAAEAQVWIERVGHGKECSVIIEDGRIAEQQETVGDEPAK